MTQSITIPRESVLEQPVVLDLDILTRNQLSEYCCLMNVEVSDQTMLSLRNALIAFGCKPLEEKHAQAFPEQATRATHKRAFGSHNTGRKTAKSYSSKIDEKRTEFIAQGKLTVHSSHPTTVRLSAREFMSEVIATARSLKPTILEATYSNIHHQYHTGHSSSSGHESHRFAHELVTSHVPFLPNLQNHILAHNIYQRDLEPQPQYRYNVYEQYSGNRQHPSPDVPTLFPSSQGIIGEMGGRMIDIPGNTIRREQDITYPMDKSFFISHQETPQQFSRVHPQLPRDKHLPLSTIPATKGSHPLRNATNQMFASPASTTPPPPNNLHFFRAAQTDSNADSSQNRKRKAVISPPVSPAKKRTSKRPRQPTKGEAEVYSNGLNGGGKLVKYNHLLGIGLISSLSFAKNLSNKLEMMCVFNDLDLNLWLKGHGALFLDGQAIALRHLSDLFGGAGSTDPNRDSIFRSVRNNRTKWKAVYFNYRYKTFEEVVSAFSSPEAKNFHSFMSLEVKKYNETRVDPSKPETREDYLVPQSHIKDLGWEKFHDSLRRGVAYKFDKS